jgi:hypothetical protein
MDGETNENLKVAGKLKKRKSSKILHRNWKLSLYNMFQFGFIFCLSLTLVLGNTVMSLCITERDSQDNALADNDFSPNDLGKNVRTEDKNNNSIPDYEEKNPKKAERDYQLHGSSLFTHDGVGGHDTNKNNRRDLGEMPFDRGDIASMAARYQRPKNGYETILSPCGYRTGVPKAGGGIYLDDFPRTAEGDIDHKKVAENVRKFARDLLQPACYPPIQDHVTDEGIINQFNNGELDIGQRSHPKGWPNYVCHNLASFFCSLMRELGYPCREIGVLLKRENADDYPEASAHVWYDGKWHLEDPFFNISDEKDYRRAYATHILTWWSKTSPWDEFPGANSPRPPTDPEKIMRAEIYIEEKNLFTVFYIKGDTTTTVGKANKSLFLSFEKLFPTLSDAEIAFYTLVVKNIGETTTRFNVDMHSTHPALILSDQNFQGYLTIGGLVSFDFSVTVKREMDREDPPLYVNIMTPEFVDSGFNDGDTNNAAPMNWNLVTGELKTDLTSSNTHHVYDIYENIIAFVGEDSRICYYNIKTGTLGETGVTGVHPSIYGNIIAFLSESTIHYFDLGTQILVDTNISGITPAIYQDLIAFCIPRLPSTIWIYDLRTGTAVDTGIIGIDPALYGTVVAFVTPEVLVAEDLNNDGDIDDWVIRYYDIKTQTMTNTGAVGRYPALYGDRIAFATSEADINQDLNGDGKILGNVIRYYNLKTGNVVNTWKLGNKPDIYGDVITFYVWEHWAGKDFNNDGDFNDPIVDIHKTTVTKRAIITPGMLIAAFLMMGGAITYFRRKK